MAGEDHPYAADDDPCPLCGGGSSLAKRRLFPSDASLQAELEAERSAAADAASEAMSMILRLQRDKSEAMMEARQYRRFAEERFAHDAAEADALRAAVGALSARLLHLGFPSPSVAADEGVQDHYHSDSVPRVLDHPTPDVGTPRTHHLLNRMRDQHHPSDDEPLPLARGSPRHARALSYDCRIALADEYPLYAATTDRTAPPHQDDDRVYTVDAVHHGVPVVAPLPGAKDEEVEIQKLKARLQALEGDRESMRHAITSMGDEIAQQLCKDGAGFPAVRMKAQPAAAGCGGAEGGGEEAAVLRQGLHCDGDQVVRIYLLLAKEFESHQVPHRSVWKQCWIDVGSRPVPQKEAPKIPQTS